MQTLKTLIIAIAALAFLSAPVMAADLVPDFGVGGTGVVNVNLQIDAWAYVTDVEDSITLTLPLNGGTAAGNVIEGHVTTNCNATIYAVMAGTQTLGTSWTAVVSTPPATGPGTHGFAISVNVEGVPATTAPGTTAQGTVEITIAAAV